jgi:serpin B
VPASTRLVLLNTVLVNGAWLTGFEPGATSPGAFRIGSADVQVPMMRSANTAQRFAESQDAVVAELPLGNPKDFVNSGLALDIVLPTGALAAYEAAGFTPAKLTALLQSLSSTPINLQLPKFKLSPGVSISLKPALMAMGMNAAFDGAGLSGMSDTKLAVTDVVHQATLDVDEAGLDAAAATAVIVGETSVPPPPKQVVVNKPFIAILRDTATQQILFVARVSDPR